MCSHANALAGRSDSVATVTARRLPQHFLFPRAYFRARARGIAPVPAYFFHQIDPKGFEAMCSALASKGLRTLKFSELLDGPGDVDNAVLITLDDGWSSAWSMALPIAKRYGVQLTLFATPQTLEDTTERRLTLADGASVDELVARDRGDRPLLTWGELHGLHESGLVEVQSHSLNHSVVFVSDQFQAFVGDKRPAWQSGNVPLLRSIAGTDRPVMRPKPGTPLAYVEPALVADRRFLIDEDFEAECIACAAEPAGIQTVYRDRLPGRWETKSERDRRFLDDLGRSRTLLQQRLPGCAVRVLAPPWASMHPSLPHIAREAGYEALAVGYPGLAVSPAAVLPITPRLFGEGLWTLVQGPLFGVPRWLATRRRNLARRAAGAIP